MAAGDDADWPDIAALQQGENAALDRLMDRHHGRILAFIRHMTGNQSDAEELTQEVFVRAYFNIQRYRPRAPFIAWLYQIARNLCRDYFRSRAFQRQTATTALTPEMAATLVSPNPPDPSAEQLRLNAALMRLPQRLRECIVLTAIEGLSHQEAARQLGVSAKAVEVRSYRARKRLSAILRNF